MTRFVLEAPGVSALAFAGFDNLLPALRGAQSLAARLRERKRMAVIPSGDWRPSRRGRLYEY
jgi:hypothetical protein